MAVLGVGLATILAVANKTLHVHEDPRIDEVEDLLPGANCGACGYPGCRAMAENLVAGWEEPRACPVCSPEEVTTIASLLGIEAKESVKRIARLACAGGVDVARGEATYAGIETCRAADLVSGGGKACPWGCLGYGDCMAACPFEAIVMSEQHLPVVLEEKCTACGNCVEACPRDLFSLHPVDRQLWVACKNKAPGKTARSQCSVACIGCGLCKKDAPEGLIEIVDNLAQIDYQKNDQATVDAIQRCPTAAIVWFDAGGGIIVGEKAKQAGLKTAAADDSKPVASQ
ncbi:MAG: (Fe-S)-binding protein [Planctomycetota bacterium]